MRSRVLKRRRRLRGRFSTALPGGFARRACGSCPTRCANPSPSRRAISRSRGKASARRSARTRGPSGSLRCGVRWRCCKKQPGVHKSVYAVTDGQAIGWKGTGEIRTLLESVKREMRATARAYHRGRGTESRDHRCPPRDRASDGEPAAAVRGLRRKFRTRRGGRRRGEPRRGRRAACRRADARQHPAGRRAEEHFRFSPRSASRASTPSPRGCTRTDARSTTGARSRCASSTK